MPTYLVGTRGTGKTTLLKALSWDERLYNESLRRQLGRDPFEKRYIGLYFKLPNVQIELLDRWLGDATDQDYATLVALYIDLCWLETARTALRHLVAAGVLVIGEDEERQFVDGFRELWKACPECTELFGEPGDSILEILDLMHPMRRALEGFARRTTSVYSVIEALPVGQIGSFGRRLGAMLGEALAPRTSGERWSFRICMDEGEVLGLRQQRVINSMVRLTEWPVFYAIAYVSRPLDATGTFLPKQTLQHADRQILVRDDMTDREFRQLAEGVVNVRLRAMLSRRAAISTEERLGGLDINGLLVRVLRSSSDDSAHELLEAARRASRAPSESPPVYETYLASKRPEFDGDKASPRARRRYTSAAVRKQMVAAYLSICREFGLQPLYASAPMVFQISDKCVRDYLWQMDSVLSEFDGAVSEFLEAEIPVPVQNRALRAAAELKMTLFRERVLSAPAEANQFVDGIARITALIQSTGRNYEQIRTPERGIFTYRWDRNRQTATSARHAAMIRDAAEAGFLRIVDDSDPEDLRFRVHASLAPRYSFSYRGAYYSAATLTDAEIESLRSASTDQSMTAAVNAVVQRITGRRAPKSRAANQLALDDPWE
ncbi:MAG TPA: hypothetical protein VGR26_19435 [Acidimicrobiales bacterium]|nr:hypothetical protein [Acidimicrobiales bacterium]